MYRATCFLSLLFAALVLAPAMAHLLEMYHKLQLSPQEYLTVQQIYRGWSLLGILQAGVLIFTFLKLLKERGRTSRLTLAAFICYLGMLAIFFALTYPVNQITANWTQLPEHWQQLRDRWEYSHASSAVVALAGLVFLLLSVLKSEPA